ncbi:MAG: hypothetical protein KDJ17_06950 [Hyphomicrobiaceae bacterium]|nr:hypothetical protein [Hyphomicrobiaceae bacterium]
MRRRLFPALLALTAAPATSHAVGLATQLNCASDYYAYCSQHPVGSPGVRKCMRANGPRLSKSCISALISDGEISKAEVERTKAKLASDKAKARQKTKAKIEEAKAKTKVEKPAQTVAERKAPAKTKREAVAKLTDDDARKVSKPQVAPAPKVRSEPSDRAAIRPENPAPKPAASKVEPVLTLDDETYRALKAREAYFVIEDGSETPVTRAAIDSAATDATSATSQPVNEDAAAQFHNANAPVLPEDEAKPASVSTTQSVTVEKDTSPASTAVAEPPPETAEPVTDKSDPAARESAPARKLQAAKKPDYPPGKMALGKPSSQPSAPAVKPVPSQSQAWQDFMNNRFSGGFNYEGMDASFARRGR